MQHAARALLVVVVCGVLVGVPGTADAKKKNKKNRGAPPPAVQPVAHPGNGIGPGGVPALRDHLLALIDAVNDRVDRLVREVRALDARLTDVEGKVVDADRRLTAAEARLDMAEARLDNLEGVVSGLVQEAAAAASDDDGDGYNELQHDCDDAYPSINPAATGLDLNCDGTVELPIP